MLKLRIVVFCLLSDMLWRTDDVDLNDGIKEGLKLMIKCSKLVRY